MNRRSRTLVGILVTIGFAGLSLRGQEQASSPASRLPAAPSIVISEVLFDPRPGDTPFVELLNTGLMPVDLARLALRSGDYELSLIRVTKPLAPGGRLIVRYDQQARFDGQTLHAPPTIALDPRSGRVDLVGGQDELLDRAAWGDEDGAVDLGAEEMFRGAPPQGRTIGRPPGAIRPLDLLEWIVYTPAEATPGAANPMTAVDMLLPIDGAVVKAPVKLRWCPVVGAQSYRVQVARDVSFAAPVLDRVVSTTEADAGSLPPSLYVWRVQALGAQNRPAPFSYASGLEVEAATLFSEPSAPPFAMKIQTPAPQAGAPSPNPHVLPVKELEQHKDTRMLQLENRKERDPHGWDRNHGTFDREPSDSHNCVVASVAMVNHYKGGDLSQDRIAYEVRSRNATNYVAALNGAFILSPALVAQHLKEKQPGPEWDLIYGDGLFISQNVAAIAFAFTPRNTPIDASRVGALEDNYSSVAEIWKAVKPELDNDRPVIASIKNPSGRSSHAFVVNGWGMKNGDRYLYIIDPIDGSRVENLDAMRKHTAADFVFYFLPANPQGRRQELEVILDTDGDGVVDFDETERFFTDPADRDSDHDGVEDKQDIAYGVFDPLYGYAFQTSYPRSRDFDQDGVPTERDSDSDDGGCRDGLEDADADGHRNGQESWSFDDKDDECGEIQGHIVYAARFRGTGDLRTFREESLIISVALTPRRLGAMGPLKDNGSRYRVQSVGVVEIPALQMPNGCHPIARQTLTRSGRFDNPGDQIGGNQSANELLVAATAGGEGRAHADWCILAGSGPHLDSVGVNGCVAKREAAAGLAYVFDCRTPPPAPPDMVIDLWSITGRVRLVPKPDPDLMTRLLPSPYYRQRGFTNDAPTLAVAGGRLRLSLGDR